METMRTQCENYAAHMEYLAAKNQVWKIYHCGAQEKSKKKKMWLLKEIKKPDINSDPQYFQVTARQREEQLREEKKRLLAISAREHAAVIKEIESKCQQLYVGTTYLLWVLIEDSLAEILCILSFLCGHLVCNVGCNF